MSVIKSIFNKKIWIAGSMTVLSIGILVLIPVVVKLLWGWIIPDLFPGAVEQGLIVAHIGWKTTLKLIVALVVFGILTNQS